jgi:hypothetical protein
VEDDVAERLEAYGQRGPARPRVGSEGLAPLDTPRRTVGSEGHLDNDIVRPKAVGEIGGVGQHLVLEAREDLTRPGWLGHGGLLGSGTAIRYRVCTLAATGGLRRHPEDVAVLVGMAVVLYALTVLLLRRQLRPQ